jgi:hypothetical protein
MFFQFFAKHFITMTKLRNRIEKHTITQLCVEINHPIFLPCIPQYVEKMHPNLDATSSMCQISFTNVQDFPCMKVLCLGHNPYCLIFWRACKSS